MTDLFALVLPASLVFTIGSLQVYRRWLIMAGYDHPETAMRPGWVLGIVFVLMLAGAPPLSSSTPHAFSASA